MMNQLQARQGDLLIQSIHYIPSWATPESGLVLAYGQATGHAHVLDRGQLYRFENDLCFRAESSVTLSHEEHGPIEFPAGCYRVVRQREYTPEDPRVVAD